MWVLLLCSIAALGAFLDRVVYFHRNTIATGDFLRGLTNIIHRNDITEAIRECARTPGPVAKVIHTVLSTHMAPPEELRAIAIEASRLELPRLERNLALLSTMAYLTPLIGLLGTVFGLLDAFMLISSHGGYSTTADIAAGVYQSLITSATGLAIAIPAFVAFSYLSSRVDDFVSDMERAGIEVIHLLKHKDK